MPPVVFLAASLISALVEEVVGAVIHARHFPHSAFPLWLDPSTFSCHWRQGREAASQSPLPRELFLVLNFANFTRF